MASGEIEQPTGTQWGIAVLCFLFALFFLTQLLGLFFIEGIAERAAVPDNDVRIPLSVRFVGLVAKELHEDNLTARLKPDGSNWPFAFRMFFALEMCGLAGLCLAVTQLGADAIAADPGHAAPGAHDHRVQDSKLLRMGLFTALAIAIHNFPEGLATEVTRIDCP